ncbi:hypothetical protein K450DRAFT_221689 [Umbelopsis ramanniana AG]|uniref:Uncharacterized protein n=1 Tax=Umbelopsis ramanniana AG TaxID=1314678 RepID=A0AAD5EHI5_UMBRA|nr:uncharacterized protein K450DRAFT_221689 [Umbelopsis ramanniana AG]KAI8583552.1 hypothetical protein K450DRAFT_221689 [Umbelopsis ramanniana AG]
MTEFEDIPLRILFFFFFSFRCLAFTPQLPPKSSTRSFPFTWIPNPTPLYNYLNQRTRV